MDAGIVWGLCRSWFFLGDRGSRRFYVLRGYSDRRGLMIIWWRGRRVLVC